MHDSSYRLMEEFAARLKLRQLEGQRLEIADVGSRDVHIVSYNYRPLFQKPGWFYRGLDIEQGVNVDITIADPDGWADIPASSYDVVVSGQMLEHCYRPWQIVKNMARIVKTNGVVCIIAPHTWPYHAFPVDCWRIFPDGMKIIMADAGLEVESVGMGINDTIGIARKL